MSKLLVGSLEFGGINHYTILYIRNDRTWIQKLILPDASSYAAVIAASYRRGVAIGEPVCPNNLPARRPLRFCYRFQTKAASLWLHIVPWGIHKLLKCVKGKYGNSPGRTGRQENEYHRDHLSSISAATRKLNQHRQDNCDVRGYSRWSGQTGMELRLQKQPYKDTESFC
ncbi:hypothetical protein NC652_028275 [Populus alba x Populus x berolinensis]|nr:hypothetical protein NC652_028275 [Populus alba x Populus x berolinensis]